MSDEIDLTGTFALWPDPLARSWRAAASRALMEVDPSMRAPMEGDDLLRGELSCRLGLPLDGLTITAGIRAAIGPVSLGLTEMVIETPTFLGVPAVLGAYGVPVRFATWETLPVRGRPGTGVWITTPCRNPDGRCADPGLLGELASGDLRVYCDSAYQWFDSSARTAPGVMQLGSLHKLAGPGARIGWIAGGELSADARRLLAVTAPPWHWQRIWGHFLSSGGLAALTARTAGLGAARAAFVDIMPAEPSHIRSTGPNLLIPVDGDEAVALAALRRVGVLASPGSAFRAPRPSVRVCLDGVSAAVAQEAAHRFTRAGVVAGRQLTGTAPLARKDA